MDGETVVLDWKLDADAGTGRDQLGREVALRPFLGVIGMPPDEPGPPFDGAASSVRREHRLQGARRRARRCSSRSPVDGALLSAGDGHAAQGDGEVSQLAIEAPVERACLTLSVRDDLALAWPIAWTPEAWLAFGFDEDLDEAAALAIEGMLDLMEREHALARREALALASVVVDLRVTQLVNGARGIHARLAHDALR